MAKAPSTPEIRHCEECGGPFTVNPKYSRAQKAKARFCSYRCSGRGQPSRKRPMQEFLNGKTRFGRLTYICEGGPIKTKSHDIRRARFRCDCGKVVDMQPSKVRNGVVQSCGCYSAESARKRFTQHGQYKTVEYKTWNGMMQRCHNPKDARYPNYGGRGITVCPEWHGHDGLLRFIDFMGQRPEGASIDRIDPDGNYEPGNVRWADDETQQNNKRKTASITVDGVTRSHTQWARHLGMSRNAVSERIRKGWPPELAATLPAGAKLDEV